MKFKLASITLAVSMVMLMSPALELNRVYANSFTSEWAQPTVDAMSNAGLIPNSLRNDADFREDISREEFAELITTYFNKVKKQTSIPSSSDSKFTDTNNPLITLANQLGIVGGYPDGSFKPNATITRQEIAVMANQAERQLSSLPQTKDVSRFTDNRNIAPWAQEGVGSLSKAGGIGGYPDGTFKPSNNMSKQEAIALVGNLATKAGLIAKPTAPPVVAPVGGSVTDIPSTPTGVLNQAQYKLVVNGMLSIQGMTQAEWTRQVNHFSEAQRGHWVNAFTNTVKPPSGVKWLVNKDTVHHPGFSHVAGMEVKTENGVLYYRVFNVGVSAQQDKSVRLTTEVNYRTDWQRLE